MVQCICRKLRDVLRLELDVSLSDEQFRQFTLEQIREAARDKRREKGEPNNSTMTLIDVNEPCNFCRYNCKQDSRV